jgi:hypothetical protein
MPDVWVALIAAESGLFGAQSQVMFIPVVPGWQMWHSG